MPNRDVKTEPRFVNVIQHWFVEGSPASKAGGEST